MKLPPSKRCEFITRLAGLALLLASTTNGPAAEPPADVLRVCLVASTQNPDTGRQMEKLRRNLEALAAMRATLILSAADGTDALREADVAIFLFDRGAALPRESPEIIRFIDSGRGVIAIGATGFAWEKSPAFGREVLGAGFELAGPPANAPVEVRLRPHPIFTGGEDFSPTQFSSRAIEPAKDVQVLMEAAFDGKFAPMAWTRERRGGRILYLGPDRPADFDQVSYFRIIANGAFWAARRKIPGTTIRIHRTWMPNAHPSSVAVGFHSGLNFCFDPVRGAMAYAWDGDYVDLWPTIAAKAPRDVIVRGEIFYTASEKKGFQRGPGIPAAVQFRGYGVENDVPHFHYEVNGARVEEIVTPAENRGGLVRRFQVETGGEEVWFEPEDARCVKFQHGRTAWVEGRLSLPARSVIEFIVTTER